MSKEIESYLSGLPGVRKRRLVNIRNKHPALDTGKGCVRIRGKQDVPLEDLLVSFGKAMNHKGTV